MRPGASRLAVQRPVGIRDRADLEQPVLDAGPLALQALDLGLQRGQLFRVGDLAGHHARFLAGDLLIDELDLALDPSLLAPYLFVLLRGDLDVGIELRQLPGELLEEIEGTREGTGDWREITQDQINAFADATDDHQFIHVDPERAAELSPWKTTIAHGFLTLSMLTALTQSIPRESEPFEGVVMGINYGFDRVRFINPVKVDARVRATSTIKQVDLKDSNTLQVTREVTVEIEGETKPALVAEWLTRMVYA